MSDFSPFPLLETECLVLREIVETDADHLFAIHGDCDLMRWFGSEPLADLDGAKKLVQVFSRWRSLPNPGVRWGIQPKSTNAIVGTCGLFNWNRDWRKCTIGYELAAHARGKGLMQEALTAALAWGFSDMALNRIEALIHPANLPSTKLASRLGFVQEGCLREGAFWGGRYHDMLQFSLLKKDWQSAHAAK